MAELVSSVEFKKADGKPITFNFQFENGLPVKHVIEIEPEYRLNVDKDYVKLLYVVNTKNLNISSFEVEDISFHENLINNKYELWIHLEDGYLKTINIEEKQLIELKNRKIYIGIYNQNNESLNEVLVA